jgi:hypothetical protein
VGWQQLCGETCQKHAWLSRLNWNSPYGPEEDDDIILPVVYIYVECKLSYTSNIYLVSNSVLIQHHMKNVKISTQNCTVEKKIYFQKNKAQKRTIATYSAQYLAAFFWHFSQ